VPLVLVLTNPGDSTADRVSVALRDRGAKVLRFDTAEFPLDCGIVGEYRNDRETRTWILRNWGSCIDLEEVGSVWYRRPRQFRVNPLLKQHEQTFALSEAAMAMGGMLRGLPCFWMNHPAALAEAAYKPRQLREAVNCGLRIPQTLITNDPGHAERFLKSMTHGAVIKALGKATIKGSAEDPVQPGIVMTSSVEAADISDFSQVRHTACLLQERIPKRFDLRITAVGDTLFPVAIHSQENPEAALDWRRAGPWLKHELVTLPAEVEDGLRRMLSTFNLHFAAIDMVLTPDNEHIFLEINPNGEWEWLERTIGPALSSTVADTLIKFAHKEPRVGDAVSEPLPEGETS
jgi:glutathione synthase/RimK-type ligase-like ATP-grasp enzyme